MNPETNRMNDLERRVSMFHQFPETTGQVPFGVAEGTGNQRSGFVTDALGRVTALLDLLQPAHRQGALDPQDLEAMQALETWYSKLLAEQDHAKARASAPAPAPETKNI